MLPQLASEIRHISGMACTAAGSLFIYSGRTAKEQLHIWEAGN